MPVEVRQQFRDLTPDQLRETVVDAIAIGDRDRLDALYGESLELDAVAESNKSVGEYYRIAATSCALRSDAIRDAIMKGMEQAGVTEARGNNFVLAAVPNGGAQAVVITGSVPDIYMKVKTEPDKTAIGRALREGAILSFAHLDERGTHLKASPF